MVHVINWNVTLGKCWNYFKIMLLSCFDKLDLVTFHSSMDGRLNERTLITYSDFNSSIFSISNLHKHKKKSLLTLNLETPDRMRWANDSRRRSSLSSVAMRTPKPWRPNSDLWVETRSRGLMPEQKYKLVWDRWCNNRFRRLLQVFQQILEWKDSLLHNCFYQVLSEIVSGLGCGHETFSVCPSGQHICRCWSSWRSDSFRSRKSAKRRSPSPDKSRERAPTDARFAPDFGQQNLKKIYQKLFP